MDRYCVAKDPDAGGNHLVHTSGCKRMPDPASCESLGDFESRASALSVARARYPSSIGCVYCTLDDRFYKAALDGLKTFRQTWFTVRFMTSHGLRVRKTLREMWNHIEQWMAGTPSRCMDLLQYVDDLKLWGRQYVFLFEVDEEYVEQLSRPDFVETFEDGAYEQPNYVWKVPEPRLVHVKREQGRLIFKLVEMRTFDLLVEGEQETFEERAVSFLVVDLPGHYAELRLQELPVGARRNVKQERDLMLREIAKHLDVDRFRLVRLEPVMSTMIRRPVYPITSSRLRATGTDSPGMPKLLAVMNSLFKGPRAIEVNARSDYDEPDVLGKKAVYFRLNGNSDYVAFDGVADPERVKDILENVVAIGRKPPKHHVPSKKDPLPRRGLVGNTLAALDGRPVPQAVLLSAGAVAAAVLWILIEGGGNYVFEKAVEKALGPVPLVAITVTFEIVWIWLYYGSRRIRVGFRELFRLQWRDIWREIMAARRRAKAHPGLLPPRSAIRG